MDDPASWIDLFGIAVQAREDIRLIVQAIVMSEDIVLCDSTLGRLSIRATQ